MKYSTPEVVAGYRHTCVILQDATLKCWGGGQFGKLGQGDTISRGNTRAEMGENMAPIELPGNKTVILLSLC